MKIRDLGYTPGSEDTPAHLALGTVFSALLIAFVTFPIGFIAIYLPLAHFARKLPEDWVGLAALFLHWMIALAIAYAIGIRYCKDAKLTARSPSGQVQFFLFQMVAVAVVVGYRFVCWWYNVPEWFEYGEDTLQAVSFVLDGLMSTANVVFFLFLRRAGHKVTQLTIAGAIVDAVGMVLSHIFL